MVGVYIRVIDRFGTNEAPYEGQRLCHELCAVHFGLTLYNRAYFAEWHTNLCTRVHILVGRMRYKYVPGYGKSHVTKNCNQHLLHRNIEVEVLYLLCQIIPVVENVCCSHAFGEVNALRAGSGRNHNRQFEELTGYLASHGSNTTCSIDYKHCGILLPFNLHL